MANVSVLLERASAAGLPASEPTRPAQEITASLSPSASATTGWGSSEKCEK